MDWNKMNDIFDKLAQQEEAFLQSEFLSPVIMYHPIRVRINGVIMTLKVGYPKRFQGWGVFRPRSMKFARFIREPSMSEKKEYLELFPVLRLIVCARDDNGWYGIPANNADSRFKVQGLVPIGLAEEIQIFDTVETRFDGTSCWFDQIYMGDNPNIPAVLRDALSAMTESSKISTSGLSSMDKQAYNIALVREIENQKDKHEERLKDAVSRAGATFKSYVERDSTYTVEYVVDGEDHRSVVNKDTLDVQSAGICLDGGDRAFDLQSLVSVVREGINRRLIHRVGLNENNNYDEDEDY
jgi:hypothetical protein